MDDGDPWNRVVGRGRIEGGTRIPLWSLTNKELLTLVPPSVTIDVRADVCQTRKKDGRCLSIFFPRYGNDRQPSLESKRSRLLR